MPKKAIINNTRVIISKEGKIRLENKTNPHVHIRIKVDMELELFCNGGEAVNLHRVTKDQIKLYYRRQYDAKAVEERTELEYKVKKWTGWQEYPKEQVVFQKV